MFNSFQLSMQLTQLIELLEPPEKHYSGHLILKNQKITWKLSFIQGGLLYIEDGFHDVRRWKRNFEKHFPKEKLQFNTSKKADTAAAEAASLPLQFNSLTDGIAQQQLSLISSKLMIRHLIQEQLFELAQYDHLETTWQSVSFPVPHICRNIALSTWERKMTLSRVDDMQKRWLSSGLGGLSPSLSPTLNKDVKASLLPIHLPIEHQYLRGDFTILEIAKQLDRQPLEIAALLKPLAEAGTLEFLLIPDLLPGAELLTAPLVSEAETPTDLPPVSSADTPSSAEMSSTPAEGNTPLIACIDDSPVLAHGLKKILSSAGYRALIIQEPMRGFSQLIEHRPDLILLDLMLPNADGYSVCKFLRDTPVFKKTPIIVLTGKSRPVDRARARLVGATEFITKPPEPDLLITMIQNHLEICSTV